MLKTVALVLVIAVAAVLLYAATRPDTYTVERSARIAAPPDRVFRLVSDFHGWSRWSPWEKLDPQMKRTFEGPASGKGAVYAWTGNSKVGEGRMEILDAADPSRVLIKLDFVTPFPSSNQTEFTFQPDGDGTQVRWQMRGPHSFMSKLMDVFVGMDRMIGKDFEQGLANLKTAAAQ